jgi:uncharacterized protein YxjI
MGAGTVYDCSADAGMKKEDCIHGEPLPEMKTYKMKEKTFTLVEDYKIKDMDGETQFKCKGEFWSMRDRLVMKDKTTDEKFAVIQKKLCSCRKNREIYVPQPCHEGQKSEEEHDGKPLYLWGKVEKRICICPTMIFDYIKYDKNGEEVPIWTGTMECCTCLPNMKITTHGSDQVVGQVGGTTMWEFTKESFAITAAKGTDAAMIVMFGIIADEIREDVAREQ